MQLVEADLLDEAAGILEICFALPREADDDIRRDRHLRPGCTKKRDRVTEGHGVIVPVHGTQDAVRTALEREVKMRTQLRDRAKRLDERPRDDARLEAAETYPRDARHRRHRTDQCEEMRRWNFMIHRIFIVCTIEIKAVGGEVDPGQHDLVIATTSEIHDLLHRVLDGT